MYLSIYLSTCLSIYLPVYLQGWKTSYSARFLHFSKLTTSKTQQLCETSSFFKVDNIKNEAILRDFLTFCTWQRQKRSNSARLPHFSNLITWKTKPFCETSSFFDLDSIQNEIKRSNSERLQFLNLTTSKTKQFCETSFKNGKLTAALPASYQWVSRYFHSTCIKYCACHEKVRPGHAKCCTCHAKSSSQNWRS